MFSLSGRHLLFRYMFVCSLLPQGSFLRTPLLRFSSYLFSIHAPTSFIWSYGVHGPCSRLPLGSMGSFASAGPLKVTDLDGFVLVRAPDCKTNKRSFDCVQELCAALPAPTALPPASLTSCSYLSLSTPLLRRSHTTLAAPESHGEPHDLLHQSQCLHLTVSNQHPSF